MKIEFIRSAAIGCAILAVAACSPDTDRTTPSELSGHEQVAAPSALVKEASSTPSENCGDAGGSPQDIAGLRVGMTEATVSEALLCAGEDYVRTRKVWPYSVDGFDLRHVSLRVESPRETIIATLVGRPGLERVWGLYRYRNFARGAEPSAESIRADLADQFGPLDFASEVKRKNGASNFERVFDQRYPRIIRAADGTQIFHDSPQYRDCISAVEQGMAFRIPDLSRARDCGLSMLSNVTPVRGDREKVKDHYIYLADPSQALRFLEEDKAALGQKLGGEDRGNTARDGNE